MVVAALALPRLQLFDANGNPLSGGKLYSYHAGTTTPLATYNSASGTGVNPNPALADAGGFLDIWLTCLTAYKISIHAANDTVLSTIDNITLSLPSVDPLDLDGYSDTVTEGNTTLAPGQPGTEVLAQNLAQEIQQLRWVEGEMKGNSNWRQSYEILSSHNGVIDPGEPGAEVLARFGDEQIKQLRWIIQEMKGGNIAWGTSYTTRYLPLFAFNQDAYNITWTATGTTFWSFAFYVPVGWQANSNLIVNIYRRASTSGTGLARMTVQFLRIRNNTPATSLGALDSNFNPADAQSHLTPFTFAGTSLQAGDSGLLTMTRLGDDALDTMVDAVVLDGAFLQYVGLASA